MLRRYAGTGSNPLATWIDVTLPAKVDPLTPEEIASGIDQRRRNLVFSPTQVQAAGGPAVAVKRDAIMFGADKFVIQHWFNRRIGSDVVRIEVQAG